MQIVIDIPDSLYANLSKIKNGSIACARILNIIKRERVVLPKHHGNLLDENEVYNAYLKNVRTLDHDFDEALRKVEPIIKGTEGACYYRI